MFNCIQYIQIFSDIDSSLNTGCLKACKAVMRLEGCCNKSIKGHVDWSTCCIFKSCKVQKQGVTLIISIIAETNHILLMRRLKRCSHISDYACNNHTLRLGNLLIVLMLSLEDVPSGQVNLVPSA